MISFGRDPITIEVLEGNIADQAVDAVVNAANNAFWMGAGVAGALKARGGIEIEQDAVAQGPVKPGECVITSGGRLPARYVIHAAVMGQDLVTSEALIYCATGNALELADSHRLESIALPAFGTGVGGFPLDHCARVMFTAIQAFAPRARTLRLVRLVLFGGRAYDAFAAAAQGFLHP